MGYSGDGFTCAGLLSINIHNLHTAPKVGNWPIRLILFLILHCVCVVLYVTRSDAVFCSPMRKLVNVSLKTFS